MNYYFRDHPSLKYVFVTMLFKLEFERKICVWTFLKVWCLKNSKCVLAKSLLCLNKLFWWRIKLYIQALLNFYCCCCKDQARSQSLMFGGGGGHIHVIDQGKKKGSKKVQSILDIFCCICSYLQISLKLVANSELNDFISILWTCMNWNLIPHHDNNDICDWKSKVYCWDMLILFNFNLIFYSRHTGSVGVRGDSAHLCR